MKKTQSYFPVRSLIPTLFCCALALPAIGLSSQASAVQPFPLAALAQKVAVVNINSASAEAIADAMKGVGFKKAQAIVGWRKKNGRFTSLDQLLEIKGIGEKTLAANKKRITL
ncbi:MAG: competence protein ComEA [Cellvibrionaceae bacterium]|jgi:competence protein ComEA